MDYTWQQFVEEYDAWLWENWRDQAEQVNQLLRELAEAQHDTNNT